MKLTVCLVILFMLMAVTACEKDDKESPAPVISSVTPLTGPKTTPVAITGQSFGTDLTKVKVYFNDAEAIITRVEDTKIECTVPVKAGTGLVKVVVNGKTTEGPEFTYIYNVTVSTLAGSSSGYLDGPGSSAKFFNPIGVCSDAQGNIYVTDQVNNRIRKITPGGVVSTFAGGVKGYADGTGAAALFAAPTGICSDAQGNIYVGDHENHKIRKITPGGVVSTLAGGVAGYADGTGAAALFNTPFGVCSDAQGNIYVADMRNHKIRKITPAGVVSTVAGSTSGYIDGENAKFNYPYGVCSDMPGNIYVADFANHTIRKITPNKVVSTFAGSTMGYSDGQGTSAQFNSPSGICSDIQGNIYIADLNNYKIRKITPSGMVSTLAGSSAGFADGAGLGAKFQFPFGVCSDVQGNIYVADYIDDLIRKIVMD